jgi:hypothetical protein
MMISRRRLLIDGAIFLGAGRYAWSDDFAPVMLEFPDVELDSNLPLVAGANTSGYNTCHLQVLDGDGKNIVWQSKEWPTEPNRSNSAASARLGGGGAKKHVVQAVMRPTRAGTPSMALAIHQGTDLDKTQMELLAEKARFVADPARSPEGGHFEVNLYLDSTVTVQIWSGTIARGATVFQGQFHNVQAGGNRVPWDLKTRGGRLVAPGRYVAMLTCTPNQAGRAPTFLGSSFGVASGGS